MQKDIKRKSIGVTATITVVISVATICFLATNKESGPEGNNTRNPSVKESNHEVETRGSLGKENIRNLINYQKGFPSKNGPLDDDEGLHLSEEELLELDRKYERIASLGSKVYRREAHRILEEMLDAEPPDRHWDLKVESFIEETEENDDMYLETDFIDVDCRTRLCKVTALHDNKAAFEKYFSIGSQIGPFKAAQNGRQEYLEDGTVSTTMYFSRDLQDNDPFMDMEDLLLEWMDSN